MNVKNTLLIALLFFVTPAMVRAQWSTSGDNVYTTNTNAKVGIGVDVPGARLHVVNGGFRHGGTGEINIDAPSLLGGRFKILDNGNVGIGVPNPLYKLDIATSGATGLNIAGNNSSYVGADIHLTRSSSSQLVGQAPTLQFNSGGGNHYIIQGSDQGLQFFSTLSDGWYERMRITPDGSVGIGTNNPWFGRLQVESTSPATNAVRLEKGKFSMNGIKV